MLLAIFLAIINFALNFTAARLWISGLDILPTAVMILVWSGNDVFLGSGLVIASYFLPDFGRIQHLPSMLPIIFGLTVLAFFIHNGYVLLFLYHLAGFLVAYALGFFNHRYMMFMALHIPLNIVALWIYYLIV